MSSLRSLAVTSVFGERFTCLQFDDVLIDPGPVSARKQIARRLAGSQIAAIVATHAHEEHSGNTVEASRITQAPIYGSERTLASMRSPERLSAPRRLFIGQPDAVTFADLRSLSETLTTPGTELLVIELPGHCEGHVSLYDPKRGILFAGDSFIRTIFTAANREVRTDEWLRTLETYLERRILTMVGTHGSIDSIDPLLPARRFVVRRRDPLEMIRTKHEFLRWAEDVVAEGERRSLPYAVIEACLFPWKRRWSWGTWFADEGGRLLSAGEFSRTYFVRSLSRRPEKAPTRFGSVVRIAGYVKRLSSRIGISRNRSTHDDLPT